MIDLITPNQETTMTTKKDTTTSKPEVEKATAPKPTVKPVEQPVTAGVSVEEIEGMTQVERLQACKPERAALAAWKAAGRQGDRPLTPIMAWLENPTKVTKAAKRSASKRVEVTRTAEQQQQLVDTILSERKAGTSWFSIAKRLTELAIPATANGNQWFNTTAFGTAKRLGLIEEGEGLSRRAGTVKPKAEKPVKPVAAKKAAAKKPAADKPAPSTKSLATVLPMTGRKAPGQRPAVKAAAASKKVTAKK